LESFEHSSVAFECKEEPCEAQEEEEIMTDVRTAIGGLNATLN
jgi:hypothetical protein